MGLLLSNGAIQAGWFVTYLFYDFSLFIHGRSISIENIYKYNMDEGGDNKSSKQSSLSSVQNRKDTICPVLEQRYKQCVADAFRYNNTTNTANNDDGQNAGDKCQKMYDQLMYYCFRKK